MKDMFDGMRKDFRNMKKDFDQVFKDIENTFDDLSVNASKYAKKEHSVNRGILTHVVCKGGCGRTVFKLVKGSEVQRHSAAFCAVCAHHLKIPFWLTCFNMCYKGFRSIFPKKVKTSK